ncbi:MAG: MOSC domain-containing protein [Alphaproteobacteria bacterium]|jgi:MOSC domain-containing protein YiiM
MGKIEAINISNISEANTFYVNQAYLEKGKGIVNDRYYENFKEKKEQVTLISLEEINAFNNQVNQNIEPKDFRRNIIVSGIDLNKLIDKQIKINQVILKIHEICQPCKYLQDRLKLPSLVKLLVNKSGVRAEIIKSGNLSVGDTIKKI